MAVKTQKTEAKGDPANDVMPPIDDEIETEIKAEPAPEAPEPEKAAKPEPVGDDGRTEIARLYRERRDAEKASEQANAESAEPAPETEDEGEKTQDEADSDAGDKKPQREAQESEFEELIVNGERVRKTKDEVKALAQIALASNNILSEAKQLREEAREMRKQAAHQPLHDADPEPIESPAETKTEHKPGLEIDQETMRRIVDRIQIGDADEGAQALAELVQLVNQAQPAASQVSAEQVGQLVRQQLVQQETQKDIDAALKDFGSKYADIAQDSEYSVLALDLVAREMRKDLKTVGLSDEDLAPIGNDARQLAFLHRQAKANGHQVRSYGEVLNSIGDHMTTKFNLKRSQPQQQQRTQAPITADRAARKLQVQQQPRTAGARVPAPQAPKPKTALEKIEEMREARGFGRTS